MTKHHTMDFHTGDWLKDPHLSMCQDRTRGIWIDAIAAMHENSRSGILTGTPSQLSAVCRTTESAFMSAVADLKATGTASVRVSHGVVTLINRRMRREAKEREANRIRKARSRAREPDKEDVTPMSPMGSGSGSSGSFSSSGKEGEAIGEGMFQRFWQPYPRKENPQKARAAFKQAQISEELLLVILAWIERAKLSEQWQNKTKIPHPDKLLNERRWEGDPPPLPANPNGYTPDMVGATDPSETETVPEWREQAIREVRERDRKEKARKAEGILAKPERERTRSERQWIEAYQRNLAEEEKDKEPA